MSAALTERDSWTDRSVEKDFSCKESVVFVKFSLVKDKEELNAFVQCLNGMGNPAAFALEPWVRGNMEWIRTEERTRHRQL